LSAVPRQPEDDMQRVISAIFGVLTLLVPLQAQHSAIPETGPESVGFSGERLKRLNVEMRRMVDQQEMPGIVMLTARHGKIVDSDVYGVQDLAAGTPLTRDTIFRIYSMSKPITGVAMMMLYEEGKWRAADPLSKYIPEFSDLKVYGGAAADGTPILKAPAHAPTVGELMSHMAGFTYGFFGSGPVDKMYLAGHPLSAPSLQGFITKLSTLPLAYEPGEGWVYSVSVDVQGYLVEKLSGQAFPDFVRTRIFEPLGMADTGFAVPESKLSRLATVYEIDAKTKRLAPRPRDPNVTTMPGLPSGGGGLYSTADDYLRFAQMLLNGGQLNGVRLLAPGTVALMRDNQLPDRLRDGRFGIGIQQMRPGFGFGYDVAVFDDPHKAGSTTGKGTFLWDGYAGTWFWIDPANDIVFVGMIQRVLANDRPDLEHLSRALVDQALMDPSK
jgi:CubicO group peptidase (beta-lactamase class C family)